LALCGAQPSPVRFDFGQVLSRQSVAMASGAEINGLCGRLIYQVRYDFEKLSLVTFFGIKESNTLTKPSMTPKRLFA
jgi:hypothetical protein